MQILYSLLIYNARLSQCEFQLSVGILVAFSMGTKLFVRQSLQLLKTLCLIFVVSSRCFSFFLKTK